MGRKASSQQSKHKNAIKPSMEAGAKILRTKTWITTSQNSSGHISSFLPEVNRIIIFPSILQLVCFYLLLHFPVGLIT